ncbi:CBS domain-containing protein [Kosmotoga pacifica]|nr:CBS domain-containing protein [Kosmotoga pacifica]
MDIIREKGEEVYSISADASIKDAVDLMVEKNIGAVMVMEGKRVIGIFTERDLLKRACANCLKLSETPVREVMTAGVICGAPDDDIQYAINVMTQHRIRHLPICDETGLKGLISIGDIIKVMYKNVEIENKMLKNYISDQYPG